MLSYCRTKIKLYWANHEIYKKNRAHIMCTFLQIEDRQKSNGAFGQVDTVCSAGKVTIILQINFLYQTSPTGFYTHKVVKSARESISIKSDGAM